MGRSVLLAAGGTAGHLLPAQALGLQLKSLGVDLLFSGVGLSQNRFFDSTLFPHKEVAGAPPFSKGVLSKAKAYLKLGLGVFEAIGILQKFRPQIVVGFGSFHSAPLILAALLLDTPYLLVESNGLPGKVNRFFARRAFSIALQFSEAAPRLKGKSRVVEMPIWSKISMGNREVSVKEARDHFGLREERETLLVFGGSQGANPISRAVANLSFQREVQVIHLCGEGGSVEEWRAIWKSRGILACVKPFEKEMDLAWRAADLAICRAGGGLLLRQ